MKLPTQKTSPPVIDGGALVGRREGLLARLWKNAVKGDKTARLLALGWMENMQLEPSTLFRKKISRGIKLISLFKA